MLPAQAQGCKDFVSQTSLWTQLKSWAIAFNVIQSVSTNVPYRIHVIHEMYSLNWLEALSWTGRTWCQPAAQSCFPAWSSWWSCRARWRRCESPACCPCWSAPWSGKRRPRSSFQSQPEWRCSPGCGTFGAFFSLLLVYCISHSPWLSPSWWWLQRSRSPDLQPGMASLPEKQNFKALFKFHFKALFIFHFEALSIIHLFMQYPHHRGVGWRRNC